VSESLEEFVGSCPKCYGAVSLVPDIGHRCRACSTVWTLEELVPVDENDLNDEEYDDADLGHEEVEFQVPVSKPAGIKKRIDERLEGGTEAGEYERILGMDALTGGEDNILFETDEKKSKMYALMMAMCYPRRPDGAIDWDIALDNTLLYTFVVEDKLGMKSNKRKGLMELVKVLRGEEDQEEKLTSRIAGAIKGDD